MSPVTLLLALSLLPARPADKLADVRAQIEAGQAHAAANTLATMLKAKEGDGRAVRLLLAEAQIADGAPEAALKTLDALTSEHDAPLLTLLGHAYRANGDKLAAQGGRKAEDAGFMYEQAADALGRAGDAGNAAAGAEAGFIELYQLGNADAARQRADKLIAKNPEDGEALLLRGCALVNVVWTAGEAKDEAAAKAAHDEAVTDLRAADAALGGKRPEPAFQLAWLYEQHGDADKAVSAAADWCDRLPQRDFSRLYQLARRYSGERNWKPAADALLAMVDRDPALLTSLVKTETDRTAIAVQLSWSIGPLAEAQRGADVRRILAALCGADPQDADIWNNYGLFARDTQVYDEAWTAYAKALSLRPDDPVLLNDGAVILHYYLHRDYDTAQDMYEKAVGLADKLLADPAKLSEEARAGIQMARRDAGNNLQNLAKGVHDWRG